MKRIAVFLLPMLVAIASFFPTQPFACEKASLTGEFTLHLPYIRFNQTTLTANLTLTDSGLFEVRDFSPMEIPAECGEAVVSNDLVLHIPSFTYDGSNYWADLQYTDAGFFQIKGYGINTPEAALTLTSPAFENEGSIPAKFTCDDLDISPELTISGVPEGTTSLALIVDDPDAPGGTWTHWTAWNIPPDTTRIPENTVLQGVTEGLTDFGVPGYGGPCPPVGVHRYFFKLHALDIMLDLPASATPDDITAAMEGHVKAEAVLMGRYERQ